LRKDSPPNHKRRAEYGTRDNEPVTAYGCKVRLGPQLAIRYDKVQEHRITADFTNSGAFLNRRKLPLNAGVVYTGGKMDPPPLGWQIRRPALQSSNAMVQFMQPLVPFGRPLRSSECSSPSAALGSSATHHSRVNQPEDCWTGIRCCPPASRFHNRGRHCSVWGRSPPGNSITTIRLIESQAARAYWSA
jgi:hypothetical protein